ncbi:unnamed protein product [Schistosoma mattheei]|uniref:Rho-GAP domain-containing protein n=1 Tax=Schistosoma mattheei TaxID=31246 RepID=A0AA85BE04_9TREM|nr:unnamed protein product [Schistosoma mattheei]
MSDRGLELRIWKNKLYNLQREAPSPHVIPCNRVLNHCPPQYGVEYHGPISRQETEELLSNAHDGSYLIRDSQRAENAYTLVIWFDKVAKNFKLYFDPITKQHFVGETKFDTVELLVADGLIHFYVETRGADVLKRIAEANIYQKTPFYKVRYHTFNSQAVEACLSIKSSENKVMNNERPLPSPLKHLQASQRHANTSKQLSCRRQSMDASHLDSRSKYQSVVFTKPLIRDWPDDKNGFKNYRNYPPLAVQQSNVCSPIQQQTDPITTTSTFEVGFSHLRLGPQGDMHEIVSSTQSFSGVTSSHTTQAHKRCADLVPCDCVPDIKQMKRVFGVDLTNLARAENKTVPTLLIKCIQEVERRDGLRCEGLYRIPGNYDLVEELRTEFDKDPELANVSEARVRDINVLTSLIKSFLRQLPVPLITYEAYPDLLDVVRDDRLNEQEKLDLLRKIFARLPGAHYESLRYFINHIHRVAEKQDVNMMTAANLAIVLSPTLLSSSYTDPISCLAGTLFEHTLIELLIKHCTYLLPSSGRWLASRPTELADNAIHSPSHRHSQIITNNNFIPPVTTVSPPNIPSYKKWNFLRSRSSTDTRTVPTLSPIP